MESNLFCFVLRNNIPNHNRAIDCRGGDDIRAVASEAARHQSRRVVAFESNKAGAHIRTISDGMNINKGEVLKMEIKK
jgi:hypothetical protein